MTRTSCSVPEGRTSTRPRPSRAAASRAAAISLVYFLIILTLSFVFYNVMTRVGTGDRG